MAESLRELRRKTNSVKSTKKITRAMELIAASRIGKAQKRVQASKPYSQEITRVLSALAGVADLDHPLLQEPENPTRAALLTVTSDRGLAGAYSANVLRNAGELSSLLKEEGKETVRYVVGGKGSSYYRFREQAVEEEFLGFSEEPSFEDAQRVASALIEAFRTPSDEGGVDEIHVVFTQFESMLTQEPVQRRILPLVVEYTDEGDDDGEGDAERGRQDSELHPLYDFEPDADSLLDAILPQYVESRIYAALLEAAASESASRQRAMKAASDNASELIEKYTQQANQARQAEITQEISEISGGAEALANA